MDKIIGLKDLREHMDRYSSAVRAGNSFIVVRKSKPIFKISPPDENEVWETVVDFTKINKNGVSAKEVLRALHKLNARS